MCLYCICVWLQCNGPCEIAFVCVDPPCVEPFEIRRGCFLSLCFCQSNCLDHQRAKQMREEWKTEKRTNWKEETQWGSCWREAWISEFIQAVCDRMCVGGLAVLYSKSAKTRNLQRLWDYNAGAPHFFFQLRLKLAFKVDFIVVKVKHRHIPVPFWDQILLPTCCCSLPI